MNAPKLSRSPLAITSMTAGSISLPVEFYDSKPHGLTCTAKGNSRKRLGRDITPQVIETVLTIVPGTSV